MSKQEAKADAGKPQLTLVPRAILPAIDRLREIEQRINKYPELMFQDSVRNTRKEYMQNFFRICNELGLSPQSRAKLGSLAVKKDKADSDPILKLFGGEET